MVFKACEARETAVYLDVNEDFEGERKVAFKRGQRVLAHFAERSNQKELNAENTLLGNFYLLSFAPLTQGIFSEINCNTLTG